MAGTPSQPIVNGWIVSVTWPHSKVRPILYAPDTEANARMRAAQLEKDFAEMKQKFPANAPTICVYQLTH